MLNIINNLKPFFEDCYKRIHVRQYSRMMKISPPTASKMLLKFNKEGILSSEKDRNYIFYYANKNDKLFLEFSRIFWRRRLGDLISFLNKNLTAQTIILFGSLSKAEAKTDSDIDLCVIGDKKEVNVKNFEKSLKRKIQIFFFSSIEGIKNKELMNNLLNGYVLEGRLRL